MQIKDLTPEELELLKNAVKDKLSYHEDNAYRYKRIGGYEEYPYQTTLENLRSLDRKLGG